jgi:hypothetical protein
MADTSPFSDKVQYTQGQRSTTEEEGKKGKKNKKFHPFFSKVTERAGEFRKKKTR